MSRASGGAGDAVAGGAVHQKADGERCAVRRASGGVVTQSLEVQSIEMLTVNSEQGFRPWL